MQNVFQHIRRQPKATRERYALAFASSFTLLVLGVWLVSKTNPGVGPVVDTEGSVPFATFLKETREQFAGLKDSFADATLDTQTATVVTGDTGVSTTTAETLILSQDTVDLVNLNQATETSPVEYVEVQIGTTSSPVTEVFITPTSTSRATNP
jgi:hypothetical protein